MKKHNFKIGDKVQLKNPKSFSLSIETLTIIRLEYKYIKVIWGGVKEREFPLYPDEIEPAVRVGEQLQFSFMGE